MRTLAIRPAQRESKNIARAEEEKIKTHDALNFCAPARRAEAGIGDRSELGMPATYRKFATKIKARALPNFVATIRRVPRAVRIAQKSRRLSHPARPKYDKVKEYFTYIYIYVYIIAAK